MPIEIRVFGRPALAHIARAILEARDIRASQAPARRGATKANLGEHLHRSLNLDFLVGKCRNRCMIPSPLLIEPSHPLRDQAHPDGSAPDPPLRRYEFSDLIAQHLLNGPAVQQGIPSASRLP